MMKLKKEKIKSMAKETKKCPKCNQVKNFDEYYYNKALYKLSAYCKICDKVENKKIRERKKELNSQLGSFSLESYFN